jgi:tight adherence protein C
VEVVLLAAALAGLVLLAGVGAVLVVEQPVERRFTELEEARAARRRGRGNPVTTVVDLLGRPLAATVMGALGPQRVAGWEALLDAAGRPAGTTTRDLAARKAAYALLLGVTGLLFAADRWWVPVALLVLGFLLPDLSLKSLAKERQEEISRTLPDFLDVLAVTVSAGLDFRSALDRVADAFEGPLSDEVRTALRQMMLGTPRREALTALRRRNPSEPLSEFVTALQQAEDLGAPLTSALGAIADDVRKSYGQEARRAAAKVEPRLSVLLTVTLVPAALLTIGVGFYVSTDANLGRLFGGG